MSGRPRRSPRRRGLGRQRRRTKGGTGAPTCPARGSTSPACAIPRPRRCPPASIPKPVPSRPRGAVARQPHILPLMDRVDESLSSSPRRPYRHLTGFPRVPGPSGFRVGFVSRPDGRRHGMSVPIEPIAPAGSSSARESSPSRFLLLLLRSERLRSTGEFLSLNSGDHFFEVHRHGAMSASRSTSPVLEPVGSADHPLEVVEGRATTTSTRITVSQCSVGWAHQGA